MFEQVSDVLEQAIRELDIPTDATALTRSVRMLDRLTAKITAAVAAFDEAEAWRDDGATSMTAWLRRHTATSARDAARLARTGRRLADLPVTAAAYEGGELSSGQVQAIVVNLNDQTAAVFAAAEAELVPKLARLAVKDVSHVMQAWAAAAKDHLQPDPAEDQPDGSTGPERTVHLSQTLDGRGELSGSLDPEARAIAQTALRLAETPDADVEVERSPARRRADALIDILRFFLDHQTTKTGGRHRPHLNVIVNYEHLTGSPASKHPGDDDLTARPAAKDSDNDLTRSPATKHRGDDLTRGAGGDDLGTRPPRHGSAPTDDPNSHPDRADGPRGPANKYRDDLICGSSSDDRDDDLGTRPPRHGSAPTDDPNSHPGTADVPGADTDGQRADGLRHDNLRARGNAQLLDGTVLDAATLHRLACDAGIHRIVMAGRSSILDYGHTTRIIPASLWAAIVARDRHCRFPGCDRPPQWGEAHHVQPWEHGGPTAITNLGLFCTRHHHILHSPGWHATMQPDGTIHITDPHGRTHTTQPPGKTTDLFTQRPPPTPHPTAA